MHMPQYMPPTCACQLPRFSSWWDFFRVQRIEAAGTKAASGSGQAGRGGLASSSSYVSQSPIMASTVTRTVNAMVGSSLANPAQLVPG